MATHPVIEPIQQGLTLVNSQEPVFPFGASHATPQAIAFREST